MPPRNTADIQQDDQESSRTRIAARRREQQRQETKETVVAEEKEGRFDRQADTITTSNVGPCILIINGCKLDVTQWARAHPGGIAILKKYHNRDATKAFLAVGHSNTAHTMLTKFMVLNKDQDHPTKKTLDIRTKCNQNGKSGLTVIQKKLMTQEDPYFIHKFLGVFCLCHFAYRFYHMIFDDPCAGMCGNGDDLTTISSLKSVLPMICLIPHALLSLSSLLFHTVPKERIVGKPMIWQEFRMHNICFGIRSLICCFVSWLSLSVLKKHSHHDNDQRTTMRLVALVASSLTVLGACYCADMATIKLRKNSGESTTATMPYWDGCSFQTQRIFKHFYAIAQFGASITCLMVSNPSWPFAVLLPIQGASFLMTLVRKGLIDTKTYHVAYALSLFLVFLVGTRQLLLTWKWDILVLFILALVTYQLRRMGMNKYALWIPLIMARITIGDAYLHWDIW